MLSLPTQYIPYVCILHVTYVSEDAKMSSNVKATKEKA